MATLLATLATFKGNWQPWPFKIARLPIGASLATFGGTCMIALLSIQAELTAAIDRVNAAYNRAGQPEAAELSGEYWNALDAEVNAAIAGGERSRAMVAIGTWEQHCLDRIKEAAQ